MESKLKKCCPNCSQVFLLKSLTSHAKGNLPLLLTCGHSMCETCIKNIVKFLEPIECKICNRDTELKASDVALLSGNPKKLYQFFPVNIFMLGELTLEYLEGTSNNKHNKAGEDDYYINLQEILKSMDSTQGKCLECHNATMKMCQQCATVLCDTCFNKTHKNFVIFKNHILTNIEPAVETYCCKTHKNKSLDYYCHDCSKSICMDCMMVGGEKSCKNHNVVAMQEVNDTLYEELNEMSPKVDETFKRLTKTAVDIGNLLHNIDNDTGSACELTHLLSDIEQHFSKLAAQIQKHKKEVVDIIVKVQCAERESLHKAKADIADAIKNAKKVFNTISSASDPNKLKQINLASLLESAKQISESPWFLSRDECKSDPLKVAVNEDLCALVTDYIQLDGNIQSVYKLKSTSELGDDIEIPPVPPVPVFPPELPKDVRQKSTNKTPEGYKDILKNASGFYKSAPKYRSKSGSVSSLNSFESESSQKSYVTPCDGYQRPVVQPVQPFEGSQHPKQLLEGSQELIYITHIIDPHNFYVQRACHQQAIKDMLREFRNANTLPKPSPGHVSEGKVYLMFNKTDNMWQRCRVVSIDRRKVDKPLIHVFCSDFGSTEIVTLDKLRLLPPAWLQTHPLALNCSLANCVPKTGSWTNDDSILIQNIIDNKKAVIHIRHIRSTPNYLNLVCDVTTFEDGISIAHALVFHERAKMPNPKLQYPKVVGIIERPKLFMNNDDFKPKSVENVYITCIVSPDKFYVRKQHLQGVYEKLCDDLEQEYSLSVNTGNVFLPEIGMVCVVNTEKHRNEMNGDCSSWARGVVTELPGRGRARVLLPDSGALLLAHWTALRHIHHKYTKLHALSTECYLAGVTPLNKKWSTGSVALLRKYSSRLLELQVEDARGRGALGVTLSDRADPDDEICINNEMIKYKFAVTFGLFKFNKNDIEEQVISNKSPLDTPKEFQKPKPEVTILKRQTSPKKQIKEKDLEAKDKGPLRLEAKVLYYQTPSLLYVSLTHQQKVFNELYEKIQKFYSTKKSQGKEEWAVGDRCCAVCVQSQTWRRAVIIELEGSNAKIFYSDFACTETVPRASLRELAAEFASIGDAAIKCHLCGVIPAVGEEWPSLTKEYLKELLDAYKRVFITKLGNFKNKSMPVEIWVYHTVQGGALEPNKSEWRCLNSKIVEQGLGIPDKTQELVAAENTEDDENLSFLNVTGSVHEWLQMEPLPTKPLLSKSDTDSPTPDLCEESVTTENILSNSNTVFISDWLPTEPFQNKEFTGMPTYIDNDGVIYLHDVCQQDTLDLIRKALDVRFKNPDPKAKYAKWTVGEPCIAMFFLDSRFYRGRVLEVIEEEAKCIIHYIDYGNEEACTFENLRKSIALYQIPIQAHKCVLDHIKPIGNQWDRQTLDYIHKSIVEKQCFVKVTREANGDLIPVELKYDKLWLNNHLVEFEMAEYTDGSKAVVPRFAPVQTSKIKEPKIIESDSGPDYIIEEETDTGPMSTSQESFDIDAIRGKDWNKLMDDEDNSSLDDNYISYPKFTEKEFLCNITIINDTKTLDLNIIHDDETNLIYEEMFGKLQSNGENMSPLNGIFENKACVALFHEDGQWYRATILQHSEAKNQIKVRYVDYGNIEIISLADAREATDDFTKLPPATVEAKLYGVEINNDVELNIISEEYSNVFLDKGPFTAKVMEYAENRPLVELRNDDGELIYESLIKKGVFLNISDQNKEV